jgi:hypothetical protein
MKVFSVGYRCSSAGILKHMGLKNESFPFDWLISRLPIIQDCIQTKFIHFINQQNYDKVITQTIHYRQTQSSQHFICEEHILYNRYYQDKFNNDELFIPWSLRTPNDTYAYFLALNHRNILCEEDHEYFKRAIERFDIMISSCEKKLYLYIHPILTSDEYNTMKTDLLREFVSFQSYMSSLNKMYKMHGLFIIIVKSSSGVDFDRTCNIENIYISKELGYSINVIHTHAEFIDAGKIFMQNNDELETDTIIKLVSSYINDCEKD